MIPSNSLSDEKNASMHTEDMLMTKSGNIIVSGDLDSIY
jgi:hypothetical protein